jgi:hypothetical protein
VPADLGLYFVPVLGEVLGAWVESFGDSRLRVDGIKFYLKPLYHEANTLTLSSLFKFWIIKAFNLKTNFKTYVGMILNCERLLS